MRERELGCHSNKHCPIPKIISFCRRSALRLSTPTHYLYSPSYIIHQYLLIYIREEEDMIN